MRFSRSAVLAAAAAPLALAQTSTDCDPTKKTCPSDVGLNNAAFSADFTKGSDANASFSAAAYTTINYGSQGAEFTIAKEGQAPTIQTDFYIFFGRIDIKMRAAPGTGIVSSIVLESDDLDEIDWEWLGGNTKQVETNFFGKGNTTSYDRAIYYDVSNPQDDFHTYTIDWNSDRLEWIIDGSTVRTLEYTDPLTNGGNNYPQTPMRLKLGNWCGGCTGEPDGTIEWAGGNTTFDNAPYTMYVQSIDIQNYNPADSYEYGDQSGSWESIKIVKDGQSSNPTGSASSVPVTASPTGTGSGSPTGYSNNTNTVAPTSSLSVSALMNTAAAVSKTVTGSAYSTNSASASAQNAGSTLTSVVSATTEVPGSSPTGGSSGSGSGAGSGSSGNSTSSGGATQQTGTSGAAATSIMTAASLLSVALGFLLL